MDLPDAAVLRAEAGAPALGQGSAAVPMSPCSTGTIVHSSSSSPESRVPGLKRWRRADAELGARTVPWLLWASRGEILSPGAGLSALCRCVAVR